MPTLRHVHIDSSQSLEETPSFKIRADEDIELWRRTQGYQDYGLFLRHLSESVVGYVLPWASSTPAQAVQASVAMLDTLDRWIDEIPPLPTPQRFGNLAFRQWGKRLEDECDTLLSELLPTNFQPAIPFISPYLLSSFGSFTRMDYGTGHETSFALFLLCLTLVRFFEPEPECERQLVLTLFVRYLRLCWRLQDVYNLEPAGSHGVWGLDDYSFLGYIFGSAELRDQSEIPVNAILQKSLPPTNLYFLSISRIHQVKHGPFHEHSSQLYSIATGVQHWSKVNSGLFKMYEAEVLGKRVVVQHIPLGGLLEWNVSSSGNMPDSQDSTATTNAPWVTAANSLSPVYPYHSPMLTAATRPSTHLSPGVSSTTHSLLPSQPFTWAALSPQRGPATGVLTPGQVPLGPLANTNLRPMSAPGLPRPRNTTSNGATILPHDRSTDNDAP